MSELTHTTQQLLADFFLTSDPLVKQRLNQRPDFNTYLLFKVVSNGQTTIDARNYRLFLCRHGRFVDSLKDMAVNYKDFCSLIKSDSP